MKNKSVDPHVISDSCGVCTAESCLEAFVNANPSTFYFSGSLPIEHLILNQTPRIHTHACLA